VTGEDDRPEATTQSTQPAAAPAEEHERASIIRGISRVPNWLNYWVPLTSGVIALVVSLITYYNSTQDPEILLILPNQVYASEAAQGGGDLRPDAFYVQPNFVATGNNDRTELVRTMSLQIEPGPEGRPLVLRWSEQGRWDFTEGFQVMKRTYFYSSDAAPFLVSPNQAQQPLSVFSVPGEWVLAPDTTYRLTLTAFRAVASTPLVATADLNVPAATVEAFKTQTQQSIITLPVVPLVTP
jgi:hypothetical protein